MTLEKARTELAKLEGDLLARVERFTKQTGIVVKVTIEPTDLEHAEETVYDGPVEIMTL